MGDGATGRRDGTALVSPSPRLPVPPSRPKAVCPASRGRAPIRQTAAVPGDGLAQPLFQRNGRLPAQPLARLADVRAAPGGVVLEQQRLVDDRRRAAADRDDELRELQDRELPRIAE